MNEIVRFGSSSSVAARIRQLSVQSRSSDVSVSGLVIAGLVDAFALHKASLLTQVDSDLARIASEIERISNVTIGTHQQPVVTVLDLTNSGAAAFNPENAEIVATSMYVVVVGSQEDLVAHHLWSDVLSGYVGKNALDTSNLTVYFDGSQDPNGSMLASLVNRDLEDFAVLSLLARGMKLADDEVLRARVSNSVNATFEKRVSELESANSRYVLELMGLRDRVIGADAVAGTLQWRIDRLNGHLDHLQNELTLARDAHRALVASRTFRAGRLITLPLRVVRRVVRKLKS